jgi:hypothetical protein
MIAPLRSNVSPWPTAISAPPKPVEVIGSLLPDQLKWKVFFSRQAKNPKYLRHGDVIEAAAATDDGARGFTGSKTGWLRHIPKFEPSARLPPKDRVALRQLHAHRAAVGVG